MRTLTFRALLGLLCLALPPYARSQSDSKFQGESVAHNVSYQEHLVLGWRDCKDKPSCPPHLSVTVYTEDGFRLTDKKDLSDIDVRGMRVYNPTYSTVKIISKDNKEIWWIPAAMFDIQFCNQVVDIRTQPVPGHPVTVTPIGPGSGGACPQ